MRKILLTLFVSFYISNIISAQSCTTPTSKEYLDINNVRALLTNGGGMWFDEDSARGIYGLPVYGFNQGFSSGIIISALSTQGNNLHLAATTYQRGDGDFWAGPIVNFMEYPECELWNRHFKLNKSEIDNFSNQAFPIDINNVPLSIKEWPAKGNQYMIDKGMTLQRDYAPFNDINENGIYDPQNGDLPLIKGDQAVYWIINDYEGPFHYDYAGEKIGVEIQIMAYAFQTTELMNTTFYDYKLINRSNRSYKDVYFSSFMDIDNKSATDDRIGVDSTNGYVFSYGESICDFDPACNPLILSSYICANSNINLSSYFPYIQYMPPMDPEIVTDDNLRGIQNGINFNGITVDDFYLNGNPADSTQESECSLNNPPGDRRYLMNSGPHDFYIGGELEFTLMVATTFEQYSSCPDKNSLINPFFNEVKQAYFSQNQCGFKQTISTNVSNIEERSFSVFPNPSNNGHFTITTENKSLNSYKIYDSLGKELVSNNIDNGKSTFYVEQKGIYFIKIETTDKQYDSYKKIVVQ